MEIIDSILKNQAAFLFILIRVAAFLFAFPLVGGPAVPNTVKVMIVLSMAFVLFQTVPIQPQPKLTLVTLTIGMLGEVLIGLVISLGVRMIFGAVEVGATIIGIQMGFGAAMLFDPVSNQQVSLIARFEGLIALLIFLSVNGHYILIRAMIHSFTLVQSIGFYPSAPLIGLLMQLAAKMFLLGVKISIPVILSLLMANITIGIFGRVIPQLNVLLFSFPITIMLGLIVLSISLPYFVALLRQEVSGMGPIFNNLLLGMKG